MKFRISAKSILKTTALMILAFEAWWVWNKGEPHAMSISGAIASLFGANSAHENVEKYLQKKKDDE